MSKEIVINTINTKSQKFNFVELIKLLTLILSPQKKLSESKIREANDKAEILEGISKIENEDHKVELPRFLLEKITSELEGEEFEIVKSLLAKVLSEFEKNYKLVQYFDTIIIDHQFRTANSNKFASPEKYIPHHNQSFYEDIFYNFDGLDRLGEIVSYNYGVIDILTKYLNIQWAKRLDVITYNNTKVLESENVFIELSRLERSKSKYFEGYIRTSDALDFYRNKLGEFSSDFLSVRNIPRYLKGDFETFWKICQGEQPSVCSSFSKEFFEEIIQNYELMN